MDTPSPLSESLDPSVSDAVSRKDAVDCDPAPNRQPHGEAQQPTHLFFWPSLTGAVLFYTAIPLPVSWPAQFNRVVLLAPGVGLGLGGLLLGGDVALNQMGLPTELTSALVVFGGVLLTGGLHVDGVMDTADGLAVMEPERRLTVMADSRTGAFGAMAAIALFTLKILALASLQGPVRGLALLAAAAWGRWGQQWAIASYPYLKATGKGSLHQQALRHRWDTLPGLGLLVGLTGLAVGSGWVTWPMGLTAMVAGAGAGLGLSAWLAARLGGHTGDTYGAVVEWTEVAVLIALSRF